jgi:hypothetical protein
MDFTFINDPANKVIADVNVFGTGVVFMVTSKGNDGLIVGKERGGVELNGKNLRNK